MKNLFSKNISIDSEQRFEEQLLQNFEFYKSAFELSKDPKLVLENCVIIRFNPVTMGFFECDDPHLIHMHKFSEFLTKELAETENLKEKCEGNVEVETELKTCSGNWVPVNINFDTIGQNGKQRTIVTVHDISERKAAHKKLEESNEFIFQIMENMPIGLGVKSISKGETKYLNSNFSNIIGWPLDVAQDFDKFFESAYPDPEESKRVKTLVMNTIKKKGFAHWDLVQIKDSKGKERLLDITMFAIEEQDSIITMISNVTQEIKDRAWLKVKSEAIKAIPNSVVITKIDGEILWVNPAFTRIYGYTLDEVKGQTPRILKSGKHDDKFYKDMWDHIISDKIWKGRLFNKKKDGTIFEDIQIISPVKATGTEITHFVAIKNLTEEELDYNAK